MQTPNKYIFTVCWNEGVPETKHMYKIRNTNLLGLDAASIRALLAIVPESIRNNINNEIRAITAMQFSLRYSNCNGLYAVDVEADLEFSDMDAILQCKHRGNVLKKWLVEAKI